MNLLSTEGGGADFLTVKARFFLKCQILHDSSYCRLLKFLLL